MYDLPLFPLHTVLFPGTPIHLHIFEPRYIEMINHCAAEDKPFGVVLIERGSEAGEALAVPHRVGCSARITDLQRLEDGRMLLTALGEDRFRIRSLSLARPYLVGQVSSLPLQHPCSLEIQREAKLLLSWMRRYLQLLSQTDAEIERALQDMHLPEDPLPLAYLSAALLQLPPPEKQPLLESRSGYILLNGVLRLVRREAALLSTERESQNAALN